MGFWQFATGGGSGGGTGDVVGPASSTDNAVARFDGATGKLIQNSAVTIADTTGAITTPSGGSLTIGDATLSRTNVARFATNGELHVATIFQLGLTGSSYAYFQSPDYFWVGKDMALKWATTSTNLAAVDTGLARSAAGVVKVTDGGAGGGAVIIPNYVEFGAGTDAAGSPAFLRSDTNRLRGIHYANSGGTPVFVYDGNSGDAVIGTFPSGMIRCQVGSNEKSTNIKIATTTVNASGATSTATNLVPAGCILLGVTTRVTTAITSGDGGTSVNIGNGTDADMYGAAIAFALGTTTNLASHTASALAFVSAAQNVVFTCVGGTFNGGVWRVCAHYLDLSPPSS